MRVTYLTGNVLDFPNGTNVLVHGVSRQGVMGAGVAAQIAKRYPEAYEVYSAAYLDRVKGELALGTFTVAILTDEKRVVNLVTQDEIGTESRKVDYEAVYSGLTTLRDALEDAGKQGRSYSICMPWIGCGLAGGSQNVIRAMIEDVFGASSIPVTVVSYA